MPPYILCPQCQVVPVSKPGELCADCQRRADEQARRYRKQLERLEKKPRRPSEVME